MYLSILTTYRFSKWYEVVGNLWLTLNSPKQRKNGKIQVGNLGGSPKLKSSKSRDYFTIQFYRSPTRSGVFPGVNSVTVMIGFATGMCFFVAVTRPPFPFCVTVKVCC